MSEEEHDDEQEHLSDEPEESEYADAESFLQDEINSLTLGAQREFHVVNEETADWVVSKIQGWERELEQREAAFKSMKTKLEKKIAWFKGRFGEELQTFADEQLAIRNARGGKPVKSVKLPCNGVIQYRKVQDSIKIHDKTKYEMWVQENVPEVVLEYTPVIDKKRLNLLLMGKKDDSGERVGGTGEIPDGATLVPEHDVFYIKV